MNIYYKNRYIWYKILIYWKFNNEYIYNIIWIIKKIIKHKEF